MKHFHFGWCGFLYSRTALTVADVVMHNVWYTFCIPYVGNCQVAYSKCGSMVNRKLNEFANKGKYGVTVKEQCGKVIDVRMNNQKV